MGRHYNIKKGDTTMKKFFTILLTISMCISLISCSNFSSYKNNSTESKSKEQTTTKKIESTTTPASTTTQAPTTTQTPTTTQAPTTTEAPTTKTIVSTDLFETVYFPYANREKPFLFEAVKTFAQSTNYNAEIIETTSEAPASIKLTDENGDYVYFSFSLVNNIEMIMSVSYFSASANTEVSLSNYSADCSPKYDKFQIHTLGEQPNEAKNPSEQRNFLFDR